MSILEEELEFLLADLRMAQQAVDTAPGPLPEPQLSQVEGKLNSAESHISAVLVQVQDAGTADTAHLPTTLPTIASYCTTLAEQAHIESLRSNPDEDYIGDRIKTIDWTFDASNGYRQRAGIT